MMRGFGDCANSQTGWHADGPTGQMDGGKGGGGGGCSIIGTVAPSTRCSIRTSSDPCSDSPSDARSGPNPSHGSTP
eukprot:87236-Pyramimonas_sp.AAC.1